MLQPAAGLAVTNLSQVVTVLGLIAALLGKHWFMSEDGSHIDSQHIIEFTKVLAEVLRDNSL